MTAALDPDVRALVRAAEANGARPFSELGVAAARRMVESSPAPPAPEMHEVRDTGFDGPHGGVPVRVYRPLPGREPAPALVYLHGGGMVTGSVGSFDSLARHLAAACGAVVLSVDYRLAPEHRYPVANEEAYASLLWAVGNAPELGVDPARLAVAGDSAGGSLAAAAALRARDENGPALAGQVLLYPGLERANDRPSMVEFADGPILRRADVEWLKEQYLGPDPSADTPQGVPSLAGDLSGLPWSVVVTAHSDPLRDGAEEYARRLRESGVPTALLRYPGVCHGFMAQAGWIRRASTAFREVGALVRARFAEAD
ncbi:alpha/beta hydrolase [Nocardiopsis changdeensis]|uniref:alpha/beta hydrolase n=1 Tax=Nocardiopsis changdeensis TaxID=2831969 RepID=UPI003F469C49